MLLGPLAGALADRHDPRRTLIASDVLRGVLILLLTRATTVPQICAITFAGSCCSSFFAPAGRDPRRLIGGGMAGVGASIVLIALVPDTAVARSW